MVIGLGNPGPEYEGNRHNVGFMVVDRLARQGRSLDWSHSEPLSAQLARGRLGSHDVVLLKPQTYMNLSGRSAAPAARLFDVPLQRTLVVHDDVDLELGRIKVKAGGGDGGHKGLRSLTQELESDQYIRVRCGVGRPASGEVTDHVLADFTAEEREPLAEQLTRASQAVTEVLTRGLRSAMNTFNVRPRGEPRPDEQKENETKRTEQAGTTSAK